MLKQFKKGGESTVWSFWRMQFAALLNCIGKVSKESKEKNKGVSVIWPNLTDWHGVVKIIETHLSTAQYNSTSPQTTASKMSTQLNQQLSKLF